MAYLIRIKYPFNGFNYHLSNINVANFNKIHRTVSDQQNSKKQKFPIWKIPICLLTAQNNAPAHRAGDTGVFVSQYTIFHLIVAVAAQ